MVRKCLIGVGVLAILVGVLFLGVYLAQKGYIPGFEVAKTENTEDKAQKDEKKDGQKDGKQLAAPTTTVNPTKEIEVVKLEAMVITELEKFGAPSTVKHAMYGNSTLVFKNSGLTGTEIHLGQIDTGFAGTVNGSELIAVKTSLGGFATSKYCNVVFIPFTDGCLGTPQVPVHWQNPNGFWSYVPSGEGFFLVSKN
jgi:hypothetical protein